MNPKFSIVVKYKYTCGKCDYTAFLLPFLRQMYLRYCSATQKFCSFFLLLHPYAHCIPSLPISFSFSNLYLVCFREEVPIPNFPGQIFTKSYFPSDCLVQILFFLFFADESQSYCIESNFPYQKNSTFQFPFYLFRILSK